MHQNVESLVRIYSAMSNPQFLDNILNANLISKKSYNFDYYKARVVVVKMGENNDY